MCEIPNSDCSNVSALLRAGGGLDLELTVPEEVRDLDAIPLQGSVSGRVTVNVPFEDAELVFVDEDSGFPVGAGPLPEATCTPPEGKPKTVPKGGFFSWLKGLGRTFFWGNLFRRKGKPSATPVVPVQALTAAEEQAARVAENMGKANSADPYASLKARRETEELHRLNLEHANQWGGELPEDALAREHLLWTDPSEPEHKDVTTTDSGTSSRHETVRLDTSGRHRASWSASAEAAGEVNEADLVRPSDDDFNGLTAQDDQLDKGKPADFADFLDGDAAWQKMQR